MPAPEGNQNGVKLKDPDIRQQAYLKYCEHLAKGKSKKSFVFRSPEYSCHWQTLESYIKDKVEFDPLHKQLAYCEGYYIWEQVAEDSAKGINKEANTASLQMVMRNKFEWDKEDKEKTTFDTQKLAALATFMSTSFPPSIKPAPEPETNKNHTDQS